MRRCTVNDNERWLCTRALLMSLHLFVKDDTRICHHRCYGVCQICYLYLSKNECRLQNRLLFGNAPKGGGVVIFNPKNSIADFKQGFLSMIFQKKINMIKGRLELFRKFIRFGGATHLLKSEVGKNIILTSGGSTHVLCHCLPPSSTCPH